MPAKLSSISEEGHSLVPSSSVAFARQPHSSLPVTAGSTLASLPVLATTDATTVCSTVAVRSDRLFQSLTTTTTTLVSKDQKIFDQRLESVPDDSDGSLVKSKLMPKGGYLYYITVLMYTKYITLHYFNYLTFCVSYTSSVNCIGFPIVSCTISKSFIDTLCLDKKLLKFEI